MAKYTYDAWGKVLSVTDANGNTITDPNHVANINPIRYRGYYYDTETGMYYLNSRYYDPQTGRSLNADVTLNLDTGLIGVNLFPYCNNSPLIFIDDFGAMPRINYGQIINMKNGYTVRIDTGHVGEEQKHIHVEKKERK